LQKKAIPRFVASLLFCCLAVFSTPAFFTNSYLNTTLPYYSAVYDFDK